MTFNSALGDFTPFPLTSTSVPIIAAYFADVETDSTTPGQVTYGNDTVNARPAFGVNWPGVEYCCGSDPTKHNLFQLLLLDRSDVGAGDFDIEFNYDQIQWETGDASGGSGGLGGSPARVGYSNGSQTAGSFFELPGSGVSGSFLDTNTTSGFDLQQPEQHPARPLCFPGKRRHGAVIGGLGDRRQRARSPPPRAAPSAYTLTATNLGPNAATGVTVTNTLPAGFTFVSAAPSGICSTAGQPVVVTCNVGSLANGANAVISIQVAIPLGRLRPGNRHCRRFRPQQSGPEPCEQHGHSSDQYRYRACRPEHRQELTAATSRRARAAPPTPLRSATPPAPARPTAP